MCAGKIRGLPSSRELCRPERDKSKGNRVNREERETLAEEIEEESRGEPGSGGSSSHDPLSRRPPVRPDLHRHGVATPLCFVFLAVRYASPSSPPSSPLLPHSRRPSQQQKVRSPSPARHHLLLFFPASLLTCSCALFSLRQLCYVFLLVTDDLMLVLSAMLLCTA